MPLSIPTLAKVRGLSRDFVSARLPGSDAAPGNNRARVLSDGNAALAFGAYQYLAQLALQFLPDTATGEWLDRWADIWLGGREAATFAAGSVNVTGIVGTTLPLATQLGGFGVTYETTDAVTVGSVATPVPVRALDAGIVGNLAAGSSLALVTAIAGVDGTATVVTLSGGVDVESDASLRDRVLARIRKPPMGGDADDYVAWAREVPGVTRAWCSSNEMGAGTVAVRFMMDGVRATSDPTTSGFPTADDIALVQAHIDLRRPVTADAYVLAPVPEPIDFMLTNLSADNPGVRAAIAASVGAMLRDRATPARTENGVGVPAQTIYAAWVSDAVLNTAGVDHFDLVMPDHLMPGPGSLAVLGTIS